MPTSIASIFERYPSLANLRDLVSDEFVKSEIFPHVAEYEAVYDKAKAKIPMALLADVFPSEIEEGEIRLEKFLGHWGNIRVEPVAKIALICKFLKPKNVFEFGTYNGMTTRQIALNTPDDAKIYTLDLPPGKATNTQFKLREFDRVISEVFPKKFESAVGSYFKNTPQEKKITQLLGDSATYDFKPYFGKMDLVFIDAAHDYDNKKSDSENALKMLTPKGAIVWDNYADVLAPDVTRYMLELAQKVPIFHLRGTFLAVYWAGHKAK